MPSAASEQLDVIAAYDQLAPRYEAIRTERSAYCDAIDRLIVANLPKHPSSLLDVGAGDGRRGEKVARDAGIGNIVLIEPSSGMRKLIDPHRKVWSDRIEDIRISNRRFDVITCLWNVLGHVRPAEQRLLALKNMRSLLSREGTLFLDVNNRYNARAYGVAPTLWRLLYDMARPSSCNGDVTVQWTNDGENIRTYGHVFAPAEIIKLVGNAGLKIQKMLFVDYTTGELHRSQFQGSMFFALAR